MPLVIRNAESPAEIMQCFPIVTELRPHLSRDDFPSLVRRLSESTGFRLAYVSDPEIKAVAGYRMAEWMYSGKYLEIEDLITTGAERSKGYGSALFQWLVVQAERNRCKQLRLVSGVQRSDAHRFYERLGMRYEAKYFSLNIGGGSP